MAKFRKGSEVVNAIRNDGQWPTVRDWLIELNPPFGFAFLGTPPVTGNGREGGALNVTTPAGVQIAEAGDWIIKDAKGGFYVLKPDAFEATYEPVGAD